MSADPPLGAILGRRETELLRSLRAPDVPGLIVGWRVWSLRVMSRGRLTLGSLNMDPIWPAAAPLSAECLAPEPHSGSPRAPSLDCWCGIYAVKDREHLHREAKVTTASTAVLGMVALWGTVVEHEHGYRAEFGYPIQIRLVCPGCLYYFRWDQPDAVLPIAEGRFAPVCTEHAVVQEAMGPAHDPTPILEELVATYGVETLT